MATSEFKSLSLDDFKLLSLALEHRGQLEMRVVSGSMEPLIMTGELITIKKATAPLKRFDIIVFWNGDRLICHYIQHINRMVSDDAQKVVITGGLKFSNVDLPCRSENILGIVSSHALSPLTRLKIVTTDLWRR